MICSFRNKKNFLHYFSFSEKCFRFSSPSKQKNKLFEKKTKKIFGFFSVLIFPKVHPNFLLPGSFNVLIFFVCLKEHLKMQGMTLPFFKIMSLFGQYTASYMILLPFSDTCLTHISLKPKDFGLKILW